MRTDPWLPIATPRALQILASHLAALVWDLGKTLKKFKAPKKEQGELVAFLAPKKNDIVTR